MIEVNIETLTDKGYIGKTIPLDTDNDFGINEDDVDGELCRAGKLLVYYGDLASTLKAQSARRKADLESGDAQLSIDIRAKAQIKGNKITEGAIKEKVLTEPGQIIKIKVFIETEKDATKLEHFFRSQQKKVDCLIALSY